MNKKSTTGENIPLKDIKEKIIITLVMGVFGGIFMYISDVFKYGLKVLFKGNGMALIMGIVFTSLSIYALVLVLIDIFYKPKSKKEIMFLLKNNENIGDFINKKGKHFITDNCFKEENKYYYVMRMDSNVKVLQECNDFEGKPFKEKRSYWLDFYNPFQDFEQIIILPAVYIILFIMICGLISGIINKSIVGILISVGCSILPIYLLIYDLIYKLKKASNSNFDDTALKESYSIIKTIILGIATAIMSYVIIKITILVFDGPNDLKTKIIVLLISLVLHIVIYYNFFKSCKSSRK